MRKALVEGTSKIISLVEKNGQDYEQVMISKILCDLFGIGT